MYLFKALLNPAYFPSNILALLIFGYFAYKTICVFFNEGPIQHIKEDWLYRLPYRLENMKFKGVNRPAYTIICLIYYSIKSIFFLLLTVEVFFFKFLLWDIWKWLFKFEDRSWYKKIFYNSSFDTYSYDDELEDYEEDVLSTNTQVNSDFSETLTEYSEEITRLWYSNDESLWKSALAAYWDRLKANQYKLEKEMEQIKASDIKTLSVYEFYDFLYERYFPWKFTDARYLSRNRRHLEKHLSGSELDDLAEIQKSLFALNFNNIKECLTLVSGIRGLGTAGASGLLAILYPEHFGTVDKFLVSSLCKIDGLKEHDIIADMNPQSLTPNNGVVLIEIMRNKAKELNKRFNTDFWTPRKIDMVLWADR